jgi:hypothetical protein
MGSVNARWLEAFEIPVILVATVPRSARDRCCPRVHAQEDRPIKGMKDTSKPVGPVHNIPTDPATHWISFEGGWHTLKTSGVAYPLRTL